MPEGEGRWLPVGVDDLSVGDRVRATSRRTGAVYEGVVTTTLASEGAVRVRHPDYDAVGGEFFRQNYRTFERWTPYETESTESEPEYRWESVTPDMLAVGDTVRVTHQANESSQREGEVIALHCSMGSAGDRTTGRAVQVRVEGEARCCMHRDVWHFERRVQPPEPEPEYRWVDVDASDLRPGDMARGLDPDGRYGVRSPEAEVTEETYTARDEYIYLAGSGGWDRGRQWQRRVPANTVVLAAPQVGDRFTRAFDHPDFGDRAGCVVRTVRSVGDAPGQTLWAITYDDANGRYWSDDLLVRPDGTCSPSVPPVDETRDCNGRYVPEPVAEPAPVPPIVAEVSNPFLTPEVLRRARVVEDGPRPLPEWATSLDAARRFVHARAIDLWRRDRNCWDGTRDFLVNADLPEEEEWPETDESTEIRAFLLQVREAALTTASDHGKRITQVEEWLTSYGITAPAPPPVRRTITVEVPAEVTEEQFRSEVIASASARNWRVV